jgi:hypothetical protein
MSTFTNFEINGVISTNNSVMQNIQTLCQASACWVTFDIHEGLWSFIQNQPGTSKKSFNDSNIIGNINISGNSITDLYNKVSVEFPHVDLRDQTDYVDYKVPLADRFPNEIDNTLEIRLQCINNPIQAGVIGGIALKQSRVDKIIEFKTDYTAFGLRAGDIISITSTVYGYSNKLFRITNLTENDEEDGLITISIIAMEYDPNVYNLIGLIREERNKKTGIVPKSSNNALTGKDLEQYAPTIVDIFGEIYLEIIGDRQLHDTYFGNTYTVKYTGYYNLQYDLNWGGYLEPDGTGWYQSPPLGIWKNSYGLVKRNGILEFQLLDNMTTGDRWAPYYEDQSIEGTFYAEEGDVISYGVRLGTNYPETYNDQWTTYIPYTPHPLAGVSVYLNGKLFFIGTQL